MVNRALWSVFCLLQMIQVSLASTVTISCGSVGKELEVCRRGSEDWAKLSGNKVEVIAAPGGSGERLSQMQLLLSARSSDIDVFLIDSTWPGILGDLLLDLYEDSKVRSESKQFLPVFISNNTVKGRLIGMPWFVDAGVLHYRKDLLEKYDESPPETWDDLTRIALKIQTGERKNGHSRFWGYIFQGRAYEGLTCNALEWVASEGGGTLVDSSGKITIQNPNAERALKRAAQWVQSSTSPISPPGVLNYMEEESRGIFQSGDTAFLRNWPYVWKLANAQDSPVKGKVGMMPLPRGTGPNGKHVGVLGGWSLAVSKYSKSPKESRSLVAYLTSTKEQKRRAMVLGQNPTRMSLYKDPELVRDNPMMPLLLSIFQESVARPSVATGTQYNRVSAEFWERVHNVLSGGLSPDQALHKLYERLLQLSRGGKW